MTSNTGKVISNSFWSILNTVLTFATGIILSVLVARFLGPEKTGVYSYFIWLTNIFLLVAGFGGNITIVKYVAEFLSKKEFSKTAFFLRRIFSIQILFALLLTSAVLILNSPFKVISWESNTQNYLLIILLALFPLLLVTSSSSILQGAQKYQTILKANIFVNILTVGAIFATLVLTGSVLYLLSTHLVIYLFSSTIYFFLTKKYLLGPSAKAGSNKFKEIFSYSGSIYLITLLDAVIWQKSEIFFLGFFSQSSEIAFYSIAYGLANMVILVIANSFNSALVPVFSQLKVKGENLRIKTGYLRTTKLLSIIMVPVATGLLVLSPRLISLVYGPAYLASSTIFSILVIPVTLAAIAGSGSALIYSLNKQWFIIRWGVPLAIINIVLDFLLIPSFGGLGAAFANSTTQILGLSIGTFYIIHNLKMPFPTLAFFKVLIASTVMGALLSLLSLLNLSIFLNLTLSVVSGVLTYLLVITGLKTFDRTDLLMLKSIDNKLIKSALFLKYLNFLESKI